MTFEEIVKQISETYREDAERLNEETAGDVFKNYGYDSDELKEEIYYSLSHDFTSSELRFYDNCDITLNSGEEITYRKLITAILKYQF